METITVLYWFEDLSVLAIDRGGPYIDLFSGSDISEALKHQPFSTVNVFDYKQGQRRSFTAQELHQDVLAQVGDER